MKKHRSLKAGFIAFILFFIFNSFTNKVTGYVNRWDTAYHSPMTWSEYFENLPRLIAFSLVIGIIVFMIASAEERWKKKKEEEEKSNDTER